MENPYKYLRKECGLTQDSLAKLADVSRQYILNLEHGLYNLPSSRVTTALLANQSTNTLWNEVSLNQAYSDWIRKERAKLSDFVPSSVADFNSQILTPSYLSNRRLVHPHVLFREHLTGVSHLIRYCKLLKLQQSIVQSYENGSNPDLPTSIYQALLDCGVSINGCSELSRSFARYFREGYGVMGA